MKSLALLSLAVLLLTVWLAASSADEPQWVRGPPSSVPGGRYAVGVAVPLQVVVGPQRPGGECAAIDAGRDRRARALAWRQGPDYKLRVIEPSRSVDCKIVYLQPDPNVDYKLRILGPDGRDVSRASLANHGKTTIVDPRRRGRRRSSGPVPLALGASQRAFLSAKRGGAEKPCQTAPGPSATRRADW